MPDPIVPSADPPAPVVVPAPPRERIITGTVVCHYCECTITRSDGDLVRMGDKAKALRDTDDKIDTLTRQLESVQRELNEEKAAHSRTREALQPARSSEKW